MKNMGIFKILFGNKASHREDSQAQYDPRQTGPDLRKAMCPSCGSKLKKTPGAKTKCPHCKKYMFVRTRPEDNARVVVNEAEAEKIAEEWAIRGGYHDDFLKERKRVKNTKQKLTKKFGKQPSENDVKWRLLNEDLITHARKGDWGMYRNTLLSMGDVLKKDSKWEQALGMYLEVCYVDVNGPNNMGGIPRDQWQGLVNPFDPTMGFLAPGVIEYIRKISTKLGVDIKTLKKLFLDHARKQSRSLGIYPISPEQAWDKLEQELTHKES